MKRRPAMKKISTMQAFSNEILKEQKLTIGMDLGDSWSFYCVLDEAGKIILEQKVATTQEAMKQTFEKIPRSLIAMETGTHSPWVSRLLTELGYEVIVAHAQKVELITKIFGEQINCGPPPIKNRSDWSYSAEKRIGYKR
jgi:transposase